MYIVLHVDDKKLQDWEGWPLNATDFGVHRLQAVFLFFQAIGFLTFVVGLLAVVAGLLSFVLSCVPLRHRTFRLDPAWGHGSGRISTRRSTWCATWSHGPAWNPVLGAKDRLGLEVARILGFVLGLLLGLRLGAMLGFALSFELGEALGFELGDIHGVWLKNSA